MSLFEPVAPPKKPRNKRTVRQKVAIAKLLEFKWMYIKKSVEFGPNGDLTVKTGVFGRKRRPIEMMGKVKDWAMDHGYDVEERVWDEFVDGLYTNGKTINEHGLPYLRITIPA